MPVAFRSSDRLTMIRLTRRRLTPRSDDFREPFQTRFRFKGRASAIAILQVVTITLTWCSWTRPRQLLGHCAGSERGVTTRPRLMVKPRWKLLVKFLFIFLTFILLRLLTCQTPRFIRFGRQAVRCFSERRARVGRQI